MKKNRSRFILGLGLAFIGSFAQAQGLEGIIVEKYYKANAADVADAAANGAVAPLTTNSVTYRVYVDMAAGYKFMALYGNQNHTLKITSTSDFYNDPNSGVKWGQDLGPANAKKHTSLLDSWMSVGGGATGKMAVLKSEDTDGSQGNTHGVLQNNPGGLFGLPINIGSTTNLSAADGLINGSPIGQNALGFTTEFDIFDQTAGNSFSTVNGGIAALGGAVGATASNMICIGQFTTDGVFGFELNIQLQNIATGAGELYVASNAQAGETVFADLNLKPNLPPTVSIASPSNGAAIITGTNLNITANAADSDGTVTGVEFFVDGNSIGIDATSPYSASYTAALGSHTITAKATDNKSDFTVSSGVAITVANNQAPTVSVSAASSAIVGDVVAISATAGDVDGTVAQVEFFVDNASVGIISNAPYTINWTSVIGAHVFKAVATDNLGLTTTSINSNILVAANTPPTAVITSTSPSANIMAPSVVTINASASDADGTVTGVEFFVNGIFVGSDVTSPYSFDWTSQIGIASITVKSTDNKGAITTSSALSLEINDPTALPYKVVPVTQFCNVPTFNMAVAASLTNNVDNVIGYDVILNYDKNKVTPTGNIVVNSDLINPIYVETSDSIDVVNGTIKIVVNFKSNAPSNTKFHGTGKIFTVEFAKTANFSSVDTSIISASFLQESYITEVKTKAVKEGKAITEKNYFLTGGLRFWSDNSAIKYDAAHPNDYLTTQVYGTNVNTGALNAGLVNVSPDLSGNFTTDLRNGLGLNITRDIANTTDVFTVVNGGDVTIVNSILLGSASLTPSIYQMIASDVNMDGVISAGDISQIRQRNALNIGEYRQAWNYNNAGVSNGQPSKDWIFVDSLTLKNNAAYQISANYPANDGTGFSKSRVPVTSFSLPATVSDYANCPSSSVEIYKGIMVGDVDGSYDFINKDGIIKSTLSDENKIIFDFTSAIVSGNSVDVPVSIVSTEDVKALDFAIKFNENELTFNDVVANSKKIETFNYFNPNDRTMRFTSNNFSNYALNTQVVNVRFDLSNGKIKADDFTSVIGLLNGKQVKVELKEKAAGLSVNAAANAVRIFPNPTNGLLNIVANENSTVEITDLTGKQVMFVSNLNANVKQEINVSEFSNGLYIVKVYNENFNSVERIVVSK